MPSSESRGNLLFFQHGKFRTKAVLSHPGASPLLKAVCFFVMPYGVHIRLLHQFVYKIFY